MIISKIHNNNVVTSIDVEGNEIVVMGRGIAFQKKPGEQIEEEKIEKVFTLTDKSIAPKLEQLIKNIPLEYLLITEEIVQFTKQKLNTDVNENIYLTLTDHISYAVERIKKGLVIQNPMTWDVKCIYKTEFEVGCMAIEIINKSLHVQLPIDEAAFIAMHLVNATNGCETCDVLNITKFIGEILDIIKAFFNTNLDEESVYYYRLITHLKVFAQRIFSTNEAIRDDDFLFNAAKKNYPEAYLCVNEIKDFVQAKYNKEINLEEMGYLILNIRFITQKMTNENDIIS